MVVIVPQWMFSTYFEKAIIQVKYHMTAEAQKCRNYSFSLPVLFLICVVCYLYDVNYLTAFEIRCLPSWLFISTRDEIKYGKLYFEAHKMQPDVFSQGLIDNFPADTLRNDYVKTMSRRHFDIVMTLYCVVCPLGLMNVTDDQTFKIWDGGNFNSSRPSEAYMHHKKLKQQNYTVIRSNKICC